MTTGYAVSGKQTNAESLAFSHYSLKMLSGRLFLCNSSADGVVTHEFYKKFTYMINMRQQFSLFISGT